MNKQIERTINIVAESIELSVTDARYDNDGNIALYAIGRLALTISLLLEMAVPGFDPDKFIEACGLEPGDFTEDEVE